MVVHFRDLDIAGLFLKLKGENFVRKIKLKSTFDHED